MEVLRIKAAVRARDGQRCVDCGLTAQAYWDRNGVRLDVHRLIPNSAYGMDGTVTLCRRCHKLRHSKKRMTKPLRLLATQNDDGELSAAVQLRASKLSVMHKRKVTKSEVIVEILQEGLASELAEVRKFQSGKKKTRNGS